MRNGLLSLFLISALLNIVRCAPKGDSFYSAALGFSDPLIVVSGGGVAGSVNTSLSLYDVEGRFLRILKDYGNSSENPRGLALLAPFQLVVAIEGVDRLDQISLFGDSSSFSVNANFTGNIFGLARNPKNGNIYVAETNTIELFDNRGNRVPISGAAPYIATTVGGCTLNTTHGLTFNSNNQLVAVSSGNSTINIYDVSGASPACVTSQTIAGTGIWDIVQHPNGYMYFVSQTNDSLYRVNADGTGATQLYQYTPNTVNPGAIAVMPDGNLLVATHGTNSIDLFSQSGQLVVQGFIRSSLTVQVNSLLVIGGQ